MKKVEKDFLDKLVDLSKDAYVPYSNFHVVAYFENDDKTWFKGVNIENSAYPNTMCAERVGIYSAINKNIDLKKVKTIHVFSPDSKDFLSPCGGCRQTISEHFLQDVEIKMYNNKGEYIKMNFSEIMPLRIDPKNIKGSK